MHDALDDPIDEIRAVSFDDAVHAILEEVARTLIDKNRKYGNSVLRPLGIFGAADPVAGIGVRIDDKLKRIQTGDPREDEDVELDLIGYLVLRRIARKEGTHA